MRERKRMSVRVKSESTEKRKKRPLLIVMRAGAERMEHLRTAFFPDDDDDDLAGLLFAVAFKSLSKRFFGL